MNKNNSSNFIRAALYYLFLMFVFFPYLEITKTGTDMQPQGVLAALGLFFLFKKRFKNFEVWLLFMLIASFLILLVGPINFLALRSFMNYFSLFFIAYISYRVLRSGRINFDYLLWFTFCIWFSVSLIQTFFDRSFLTMLVSASRTTGDRGVTGLAPEPTFLGVVFIFYILFALHRTRLSHRKLMISLSVVGALLFAKSSMALLVLVIMLSIFLITHANFKGWFISIVGLMLAAHLIDFFEGTRIYSLVETVKSEPVISLLADASINDRFFHVYFSVKGFFENWFIPNGYETWLPYVTNQLTAYRDVVIVEWFSLGGRIMSGFGAGFFELGVIFLIVPLSLIYLIFKIYSDNFKNFIFFSAFISAFMFSAIPIGFPLFAFYIGFLSFLYYEKERIKHSNLVPE